MLCALSSSSSSSWLSYYRHSLRISHKFLYFRNKVHTMLNTVYHRLCMEKGIVFVFSALLFRRVANEFDVVRGCFPLQHTIYTYNSQISLINYWLQLLFRPMNYPHFRPCYLCIVVSMKFGEWIRRETGKGIKQFSSFFSPVSGMNYFVWSTVGFIFPCSNKNAEKIDFITFSRLQLDHFGAQNLVNLNFFYKMYKTRHNFNNMTFSKIICDFHIVK